MAPPGVSFHLLIQDQGLVLSAILVPSNSNGFMLCPWVMSFFQKLCPAPFPPVTALPIGETERLGLGAGLQAPPFPLPNPRLATQPEVTG